ncbi:MAG: hypothetical protein M1828_006227 [Chrysothrix sp. TS-e1954]|nr:MAG: hypothetical protein M1828_006227 [Chrysothrix sp. TS-e1954]
MCQLCNITTTIDGLRWPTPLKAHVEDVKTLIPSVHAEVLEYQAAARAARVAANGGSRTSEAKKSESPSVSNGTNSQGRLPSPSTSSESSSTVDQSSPSSGAGPTRSTTRPRINITKSSATSLAKGDITLPLKRTFQLLNVHLEILQKARCDWFHSRDKVAQRRQWANDGMFDKVQAVQVINNKCGEAIEMVRGIMGRFLKWVLGFEDGVEAFYEELEGDR